MCSSDLFTFPTLNRIVANWRKRRQLRQLERLDDHVLMDIGLTRDELIRVQRVPLALDPVSELLNARPMTRGLRHK